MRYVLSLFLSLALLATSSPALAQIKKEVSDITETKRLVSQDMRTLVSKSYPGHGSFQAEYESSPEEDSVWQLSLFGFAEEPTDMTATDEVTLTADGKTITPITVDSRMRELDNSVVEIKDVTFTRSAYRQIATAESVTATVASFEFELTHPLRKDLRLILDRVPKEKGPQTASSEDSVSSQ